MQKNKLPKGYRFQPYDLELVIDFLKRKVNKQRIMYDDRICDIYIYDYTPEELHTVMSDYLEEGVLYCFTPRFRNTKGDNRPNRKVKKTAGNWKKTNGQIEIRDRNNVLVGYRTTLDYWRQIGNEKEKTSWIMQEYTLSTQTPLRDKQNELKLDEWVLCKIYFSTRGSKSNVEERNHSYAAGKKKSSSSSNKRASSSNSTESSAVDSNKRLKNVQSLPPCSNNPFLNTGNELGSSQNVCPIGMDYSRVDLQEQMCFPQVMDNIQVAEFPEPQCQVPFPQDNTLAGEKNQDAECNDLYEGLSPGTIELLKDLPDIPFKEVVDDIPLPLTQENTRASTNQGMAEFSEPQCQVPFPQDNTLAGEKNQDAECNDLYEGFSPGMIELLKNLPDISFDEQKKYVENMDWETLSFC